MRHHRFGRIAALILLALLVALPLSATSPNIVISQIYGGDSVVELARWRITAPWSCGR